MRISRNQAIKVEMDYYLDFTETCSHNITCPRKDSLLGVGRGGVASGAGRPGRGGGVAHGRGGRGSVLVHRGHSQVAGPSVIGDGRGAGRGEACLQGGGGVPVLTVGRGGGQAAAVGGGVALAAVGHTGAAAGTAAAPRKPEHTEH